jgi:hypothetical protein
MMSKKNDVKKKFIDDVNIKLNKIEKATCTFKKVVAITKVNQYVANNLDKLFEANVLCYFSEFIQKFLHVIWKKVNELRQEIKLGNLKDIPDKHFDKFVKSVYEMEQKAIEGFERLNITQY